MATSVFIAMWMCTSHVLALAAADVAQCSGKHQCNVDVPLGPAASILQLSSFAHGQASSHLTAQTPSPTASPTPSPTPSFTQTPSPTALPTPSPTPSFTQTCSCDGCLYQGQCNDRKHTSATPSKCLSAGGVWCEEAPPLWRAFWQENLKCNDCSPYWEVDNQMDCKKDALAAGHGYYAYDSSRNLCQTAATCKSPIGTNKNPWTIYSQTCSCDGCLWEGQCRDRATFPTANPEACVSSGGVWCEEDCTSFTTSSDCPTGCLWWQSMCQACIDVQPPSSWWHPTCESQLANTKKCAQRRAGTILDGYCARTCGVCVEAPTPAPLASGAECTTNRACESGHCLGGRCCNGQCSTWLNCASCDSAGWCAACDHGYSWISGTGCQALPTPSPPTQLTCPAGYVQIDTLGADIAGCGLEECDERSLFDSAGKCAEKCRRNQRCKSFTYAPTYSSLDPGLCTLYWNLVPDRVHGSEQVFCQALVCPDGYKQRGTYGADILGCGLEECDKRSLFDDAQQCAEKCTSNPDCKSFTYRPHGAPTNPRICTMYARLIPTDTAGDKQIFCQALPECPMHCKEFVSGGINDQTVCYNTVSNTCSNATGAECTKQGSTYLECRQAQAYVRLSAECGGDPTDLSGNLKLDVNGCKNACNANMACAGFDSAFDSDGPYCYLQSNCEGSPGLGNGYRKVQEVSERWFGISGKLERQRQECTKTTISFTIPDNGAVQTGIQVCETHNSHCKAVIKYDTNSKSCEFVGCEAEIFREHAVKCGRDCDEFTDGVCDVDQPCFGWRGATTCKMNWEKKLKMCACKNYPDECAMRSGVSVPFLTATACMAQKEEKRLNSTGGGWGLFFKDLADVLDGHANSDSVR